MRGSWGGRRSGSCQVPWFKGGTLIQGGYPGLGRAPWVKGVPQFQGIPWFKTGTLIQGGGGYPGLMGGTRVYEGDLDSPLLRGGGYFQGYPGSRDNLVEERHPTLRVVP